MYHVPCRPLLPLLPVLTCLEPCGMLVIVSVFVAVRMMVTAMFVAMAMSLSAQVIVIRFLQHLATMLVVGHKGILD